MADAVSKTLEDHFARAWDMVLEAMRRFPEEQWCEAADSRMQPARITYHLLMASDRYTWLGAADEYLSKRPFNLDWVNAPASDLPDRDAALRFVEQAKEKSQEWIRHYGDSGLLDEKPMWPWTGDSALAQGLYHLRHLQHHMAELNVELRRRGLATVSWK